jgi:hypothetical protein
MAELTQKQLEELDQGKPVKPTATFYEKAYLNRDKSREVGRRVYETCVYVQLKQPGIKDNISYKATAQDVRDYPEAYDQFMRTRQGSKRTIPIETIPGLQLEHMQELLDMGITTVNQVCDADILPAHLEYVRKPAMAFMAIIEETNHGNEEENSEEKGVEEARDVLEVDRQENGSDVGQPVLQEGRTNARDQAPEGAGTGGQEHRPRREAGVGQVGYNIDNWKVDMVWRN